MDRFDKSFNDVDKATGRPFSFGHPDGVWMITILFGLFVTMGAFQAIMGFLVPLFVSGAHADPKALFPLVLTSVLYVPPIVLLVRRSAMAVTWTTALVVLSFVAGVGAAMKLQAAGLLEAPAVVGIAAGIGLHAYVAYYVYKLRVDDLLK